MKQHLLIKTQYHNAVGTVALGGLVSGTGDNRRPKRAFPAKRRGVLMEAPG
jgi:hypothetical protein